MSLWNYIKEKMQEHPKQTIGEKDVIMTYEDMITYAEVIAEKLSNESCCSVYCRSEMATAMGILGCLAAEVTVMPLSFRYGNKHAEKILNFVSPTCIITDLTGELGIFSISDSEYMNPKASPAFMMCTSGTGGTPKGVMLSGMAVKSNIEDISRYFKITDEDHFLIFRPLYHSAVLTGEFLVSLVKGVKITFSSEEFDPIGLLTEIKKKNITAIGGTPTTIGILSRMNRKKAEIPLKHIVVSGECLSAEEGKKIRESFKKVEIYHVYGLTEASPRVCYLPPEYFDKFPDFVGRPLQSVKVKILDKNGDEVKAGTSGMLYVSGDSIMNGYYNAPELTDKVLNEGWLCTGDIALENSEGFIKILGRSDDMIIRGGINIYPQEIESELKKDERVVNVLAYKLSGPGSICQIALKVEGKFNSIDEVKQLCIKMLPPYQVPSHIELVDHFEKTVSGKIVRR